MTCFGLEIQIIMYQGIRLKFFIKCYVKNYKNVDLKAYYNP